MALLLPNSAGIVGRENLSWAKRSSFSDYMSRKAPDPGEIAENAAKELADAETQFAEVAAQTDAAAAFASYALVRLTDIKGDSIGKHARPAPAAVE